MVYIKQIIIKNFIAFDKHVKINKGSEISKNKLKIYQKPREFLEKYPDGLVLVCPSFPKNKVEDKEYGEKFFLKYGA